MPTYSYDAFNALFGDTAALQQFMYGLYVDTLYYGNASAGRRSLQQHDDAEDLSSFMHLAASSREQTPDGHHLHRSLAASGNMGLSDVFATLGQIATVVMQSNQILFSLLQSARNSIRSNDMVGMQLNITDKLVTAARTEKVQLGSVADLVAEIGVQVGLGDVNATRVLTSQMLNSYTGE